MPDDRRIDSVQVKLVHIAKHKLGLSDEEYRSMLMERYPSCFGSCKDLSYDEASDLIDHFKKLGFKIITKRYEKKKLPPNVIELPSPQILKHIEHLRDDVRWYAHDRGQKFIQKFLKKNRPSTMREAQKLVEALKAMKVRQQKAHEPDVECYRDGYIRGEGRVQW